ncbi:MAG: T9SS type A sorting domain-containing protein [Bacteroidetes bacterium]|nr:T9SS type A sorting domain-containing protein [Bacteroidota bacterium]
MKSIKFFLGVFLFSFLLTNISFAQCPDGLMVTLITTGPSTCQCYFALATGGIAPYSYNWSGGEATPELCNAPVGTYLVVVTDGNGCDTSISVTILTTSGISLNMSSTMALCTNGTATASVTGGTPPYQFQWNTVPPQTDSIAIGLHANQNYYVTVSDDSGCVQTGSVSIATTSNLGSGINFSPDTCGHGVGALTGYAVSGIPPYTYLWNSGDTVTALTNLNTGYFTFTVTDDSGCVSTSYQPLINFSPVQVTHSEVQPSCTDSSGSITLNTSGGTPAYNYFWNTIPPQSTNVASNLIRGTYSCLITDQQGCQANVAVILTDNSNFSATANAIPDTCGQGVGVATAFTQNGVAPFTFKWNQLAPSPNPVLSNLYQGWNTCWVTDDSGCVRKALAYVGYFSPLNVSSSSQNASCIFTADGSATAIPTGGTQPYTYTWTNGTGGSVATGFLPGWYSVYVTDAQGCADASQFFIGYDSIAPCAVTIMGTVFNDTSANCLKDPGEIPISNVKIGCMPLGGYKWTDVFGKYNFYLPPGNYAVTQYLPPWHTQLCPAANYFDTLPVVGMIDTNDFANAGDAVDLDINCFGINVPIPGFDYHQSVYYRNQGSKTVNNVYVTVQHDPRIVFLYSQPAASNYNSSTNTITIPVGSLAPFGNYTSFQGQVIVNYHVPDTLTLGSVLYFADTIFPVWGDTVPLNNYEICTAVVVGSYDPNSIEASPKGNGYDGYISTNDSIITYTVRFQNTGTWAAHNVTIEVQLDSDLDLSTFEMQGASFNYTLELSSSGLAKVVFGGINLPDSNYNEAQSHGYFAFSIKQKPNLAENTQIIASANIYFDFNYPILTNNALNTILAVDDPTVLPAELSVSPNPSHDIFNVNIQLKRTMEATIELFDVMGNRMMQRAKEIFPAGTTTRTINTGNLASGIYFISVITDEGMVSGKVIKY